MLVLAAASGACGDTTAGDLFPGDAGVSGLPALGGRGGRGGSPGPGGSAGSAGSASQPDAGGVGDGGTESSTSCTGDDDCADGSDCTIDTCVDAACVSTPVAAGVACGDALESECTRPDTCDGAGICAANHEQDGVVCADGACAAGECTPAEPAADCPSVIATELPFEASWRTVGGVDLFQGSCDIADTPDFAVVFTVTETGVYRFEAAGVVGDDDPEPDPQSELADSVLTVVAGSCAGRDAMQLDCNDDANDQTFDSRVDLVLEAGQSVTVYVNEFREVSPGGGSGTVSIRQLQNDD
jgi:hypothetical protein